MMSPEMARSEWGLSPSLKGLMAVVAAFLFACSGPGRAPGESAQATAPQPEPPRPQVADVAALPAPPPAQAASVPSTLSSDAAQQPAGDEAAPDLAPGEGPMEPGDGGGTADEPPPRPIRRAPSGERVYSNEDLKKYSHLKEDFGLRDGVVVADLSAQQGKRGDTIEKPKSVPATREEWDREYRVAFQEVERLTEELKYLEARAASLHNPLLPRARPNEADSLAEAGMDNKERLARVNDQIARTQRDLDAAKRHFGEIQDNVPPQPPSADQ